MPNSYMTLSDTSVRTWLETSKPGHVLLYHVGFLSIDRCNAAYKNGVLEYDCTTPISDKANMIIEAWEAGKVHIFQRKIADMKYEYLAVKRNKYGRNW
jgi:hypothetical protein